MDKILTRRYILVVYSILFFFHSSESSSNNNNLRPKLEISEDFSEEFQIFDFQEKFLREKFCEDSSLSKDQLVEFFHCSKNSTSKAFRTKTECLIEVTPQDIELTRRIGCGNIIASEHEKEIDSYSDCIVRKYSTSGKNSTRMNDWESSSDSSFLIENENLDCLFKSINVSIKEQKELIRIAKDFVFNYKYIHKHCKNSSNQGVSRMIVNEASSCIYKSIQELKDCSKDSKLNSTERTEFYCNWFQRHLNGYKMFDLSTKSRKMVDCMLNYNKKNLPNLGFQRKKLEFQERKIQKVRIF